MNNLSRVERLTSAIQTLQATNSNNGRDIGFWSKGQTTTETQPDWCLATFAGRFTELSSALAGASLTLAFRLVIEVQKQGEPMAWITHRNSTFFPPDVADYGIDVTAVPVICGSDNITMARTAEHLLRSGAFGLIVLDFGANARLPEHAQSRLTGQARQHQTALICITEKEIHQPSLGSLVSLRAHTARTPHNRHRFYCCANIVKDKRCGPSWNYKEVCHGPDGLY